MDTVKYSFHFSDAKDTDSNSFRFPNFLKTFPYPADRIRYVELSDQFEMADKKSTDGSSKKCSTSCDVFEVATEPIKHFLNTEWRCILDRAILAVVDSKKILPSGSGRPTLKLKPSQEFIFSALYSDKSLFVCGPPDSGKTEMAVTTLLQKMRTIFCSSPPHVQCAPCCIMLTATAHASTKLNTLMTKLTNASSFIPGVQAKTEGDITLLSKLPFYIIGTPDFVIDLIKKHKIDLRTVRYLLAAECDRFDRPLRNQDTYINKITELLSLIRSRTATPVCCFLSNTYSISNLRIKQFFKDDDLPISVVIKPSKEPIDIRVQLITDKCPDGFKKKLQTLFALVAKFQKYFEGATKNADNKKPRRKFLVLANSPEQVIYLHCILRKVFTEIDFQFFNRNCLHDFCETNIYTWEFNTSGSSFVLVTEYAVIDKLSPGFVDQVLCFDLPPVRDFESTMNFVINLSSRLTRSHRFLYVLFNVLEQQKHALAIINLLRRENCKIPKLLKDLCVHILSPSEISESLAKIFV